MRGLLAVSLAASLATSAWADDRPLTKPTHDVDITYLMLQTGVPGGPRLLRQRMRWAVDVGKLRVDPPTDGLWIVIDYRTHQMATVQDSARTVMVMGAPEDGIDPGANPAATFIRHGQANIAGLSCTDWETKDVSGTPTLVCLTADGVLLRAIAAGRVLLVAGNVTYGPVDQSVFAMPPGYQTITPPPPDGKPPK